MNANRIPVPLKSDDLAILRQRAQDLAREEAPTQLAEASWEVIEFALGDECYAIPTQYVREVCPVHDLTPVPCTPPHVSGIINLRGEIVAVLEPHYLLGLPDRGFRDRHQVIVLQSEHGDVGLLVDAIHCVRTIRCSELHPAPPTLTGQSAQYLRGVTAERLILIDALRLLADPQLVIYEEQR